MTEFNSSDAIAAVESEIPEPDIARCLHPEQRVYTESKAKLMILNAYLMGIKHGQTVTVDSR